MSSSPQVEIPTIVIPQPDGAILVKPGKPVIVSAMISIRQAARLLGLSARTVEYQCSIGRFRTAHKPGGQPRSQWRIARAEVLARRSPPDL